MSTIMRRIPVSDAKNNLLPIVSSCCSRLALFVLMDTNENIQEKVRSIAIIEVTSSMILDSALLLICNEVITKRQNPNKFADVLRMCCDVLFAIW